jgi:acetyl-CoA C-acetyltransferase
MIMSEAFLVDAVRSPVGRRRGGLAQVHPADLGAHVLQALIQRTGLPQEEIDDVIFGCVDSVGPQAGNIARTCWLAAGFHEGVPGVTIDRQCGSSQQALHFAAQGVMSGTQDLVIAGGVQNMSMVPIGSSILAAKGLGHDDPFSGSVGWIKRYGEEPVNQFYGAEMIAKRWGCTRLDMEKFSLASHEKALAAQDAGLFDAEISPLLGVEGDEGPRRGSSLERLAELDVLMPNGRLTAACASQISDGAAALMIASEAAVKRYDLKPRARIAHLSVRGADPIWMLTAPIPATLHALKKSGLKLDDIDLYEVNEAFASVPMAWQRELNADSSKLNVNGGAIALGHPLGATGARLMTSMLNELERRQGRYGLLTMCEGGGLANVTIIERL